MWLTGNALLTDPFPDMKEKLMIKQEIKAHLENVILPFWQELKDTEYGGFCGFVGEDLRKDFRADKGCITENRRTPRSILTARLLRSTGWRPITA